VVRLGSKSHGSTVAASSAGFLIVGATCVPGQSDEDLNAA
jgi:hypothetical protein